jgi:hypothetical protein
MHYRIKNLHHLPFSLTYVHLPVHRVLANISSVPTTNYKIFQN